MKFRTLSSFLIYTVILLGLTAIAIYDVTKIISDYIYDNRMTTVRLTNITDKFPFIARVRFCLWYERSVLEPLSAIYSHHLDPEPNESFSFQNFMKESLELGLYMLENSNWKNHETQSIYDLGMAYLFATFILDQSGPEYFLKWLSFFNYNKGIPKEDIIAGLDAYITNKDTLDFTESMWDLNKPFFIRTPWERPNEPVHLETSSMLTSDFCFSVSNWDVSLRNPVYYIDQMFPALRSNGSEVTGNRARLSVYVSNQLAAMGEADPNKSLSIDIAIVNAGVFDTSEFPPCTNDFFDELACLDRITSSTISEICRCTRFSDALEERFQSDQMISERLCTAEIYLECWVKAMNESTGRLKAAEIEKSCNPCITFKNTFQVSMKSEPENDPNGRFRVSFRCDDRSYTLFKERSQINLSQLISQVGGDLGLYIGFSMISVLELILLLYRWWSQERMTGSNKKLRDHFIAMNFTGTDGNRPRGTHESSVPPPAPPDTATQKWVLDLVSASHHDLLKHMKRDIENLAEVIHRDMDQLIKTVNKDMEELKEKQKPTKRMQRKIS